MKDVVISRKRIERESLIFIGCFLAALGVNVYAIIRFKTEWKELITTLHITLAIALLFFVLVALLRGLVFCCRWFLSRKAA
jgi:hypothetical protein